MMHMSDKVQGVLTYTRGYVPERHTKTVNRVNREQYSHTN